MVNTDYCRPENAHSHDDDRMRVVDTKGILEVIRRDGNDEVCLVNAEFNGVVAHEQPPYIFEDFVQSAKDRGMNLSNLDDSFRNALVAIFAHRQIAKGYTLGHSGCKRLRGSRQVATVLLHSATLISIRDQRCYFLAKTPCLQAFSASCRFAIKRPALFSLAFRSFSRVIEKRQAFCRFSINIAVSPSTLPFLHQACRFSIGCKGSPSAKVIGLWTPGCELRAPGGTPGRRLQAVLRAVSQPMDSGL